jgi:predicted nucleotidyltransferase
MYPPTNPTTRLPIGAQGASKNDLQQSNDCGRHFMVVRLPPDFSEFLNLLNKHDVKYLLIGGYAVGFYGYVRATNDIDVWIESTGANAVRVEAAVREFGFDVPELNASKLIEVGKITRMGNPPMRIEILNSISGITFDAAYPNRTEAKFDGLTVPVISLADLVANKLASGRTKDMADAEELGRAKQ